MANNGENSFWRQARFDMEERLPESAARYDLPREVVDGDVLALDLETGGLSPIANPIVAVLLHLNGATHIRRPDRDTAEWLSRALDKNATILTQNGHAFDFPFIRRWFADLGLPDGANGWKAKLWDTTVADSVLRPRERHSLEIQIKRWLGVEIKKDRTLTQQGFIWPESEERMSSEQERYCHDDVQHLSALMDAQAADAAERLPYVWREMSIQPAVTSLHLALLPVDGDLVGGMLKEAESESESALGFLNADGLENPRATTQVTAWLEGKGVEVENTGAAALSNIPEAAPLLKYREAEKMRGQLAAIKAAKDSEGGFRGSYRQHGARTARFTGRGVDFGGGSQQPQNIARDIRAAGVFSDPERWYATCDLSGVELRIHAAFRDSDMAQAFRDRRDLHNETQRRGNYADRTKAKNCNFCLAFGGGQAGAKRAGIDLSQADILSWRGAWPQSAKAIDRARRRAGAAETGKTAAIDGSFGYRDELVGNELTPQNLLNRNIQATAAIGLKGALLELARMNRAGEVMLALHDEVLLGAYGSEEEATAALRDLEAALIKGVDEAVKNNPEYHHEVPIEVEGAVGHGWAKP